MPRTCAGNRVTPVPAQVYATALLRKLVGHRLGHMPLNQPAVRLTEHRASLFRNGRHQAVRIPREFEMEGTEVLVRKDGGRLILTPIRKNGLMDLLASWEPLEDSPPEVEDPPPPPSLAAR